MARFRSLWSWLAVGLVTAVLLRMFVMANDTDRFRVTKYDVFGYYLYLPATFIYHDLGSLSFVTPIINQYELTNRGNPAHPLGNYEVSRAQTNPDRYVIKYTMGLAILYYPFFQAAHFYTRHFTDYPADGYSDPYQRAVFLAGFVYALLGLLVLRRLLRLYFPDALTAVLLVVVYCGTNYLCYAVWRSLYSHNFLFGLHACTLLLTHYWLRQPRWRYVLGLALSIGLAVLIRPTEAVILLVPLLLGVASGRDLWARLLLFWQRRVQVLLFGLGVLCVMLPQLLYWHRMSGHWVYDSYPGETFNFWHPRLKSGLYSFNNGWLTYTPVMLLAILGLAVLWWRRREWFWLASIYLAVHLWTSYSWWCWWYMDSFGSRTMVQAYPILALPLGMLLYQLLRRGLGLRLLTGALLVGFVVLNSFQLWQLSQGIFVSEYMTYRYYRAIFGKTQLTKADLAKYDTNEADPEPDRYQVVPVFKNEFNADSLAGTVTIPSAPTPVLLVGGAQPFSPAYRRTLRELGIGPGDWVRADTKAFYTAKEGNIHGMPGLVIQFERDGQNQKWQSIRITNKVGPATTIYGGEPNVWDTVGFASQVPADARPDDTVAVYVRNEASALPFYIDDLTVAVLRQR